MSTSNAPIDVARRIARTVVQVGIPTFLALAGLVPFVLAQAGTVLSPDMYARLVALAAGITAAAAFLAKVMANPTVNDLLRRFKLDAATGSSGADITVPTQTEPDTNTTVVKLSETNSGEFTGTPAY